MDYSLQVLVSLLVVLVFISVFFSLAETAMLSINRYRLHHLACKGHVLAKQVQRLLKRPDRLLGVILLGDTFADIFASAVATVIAMHLFGDNGVWLATAGLTLIILIFGNVAPKTVASLYPQPIAFFAAWPLTILLKLLYPLVWLINTLANTALRLLDVRVQQAAVEHFTHEELTTLLHESTGRLAPSYRSMLLKVLNLGKVTVEDIMVPTPKIIGIDIESDWETIFKQLTSSQYTHLPVYKNHIDQVIGTLHMRKICHLLAENRLNKAALLQALTDVYFVLEGTSLNLQLLNFRHQKQRIGLVVNEYGEVQGLVTLADILEEIVGKFTTDTADQHNRAVLAQPDGSYIVDGAIPIRELNRILRCQLPTQGPKTLSGVLIEHLETIPQAGTTLRLGQQLMEIIALRDNTIKAVKISPLKKS